MLHLLRIEWMKLKNYRTFWILSILYIVSVFGANYIIYRIQQSIYEAKIKGTKGMAEMLLGGRPYSFPDTWQTTANVSSFVLFIPGLIMIICLTNEYSYKTHRQNIIDGITRNQFIFAKIGLAFLIALLSTLVVFVTAFLFGVTDGHSSFDTEKIHYIALYLLQSFSYVMMAVLMGVFLKRGGLSIGIYFLYSVVLENALAFYLNRHFDYAGRYLPLETTDVLIPFPNIQEVTKRFVPEPNYSAVFVAALIYLVLYIFISIKKFETSDL